MMYFLLRQLGQNKMFFSSGIVHLFFKLQITNWERRGVKGLLASKNSNCKGIAQPHPWTVRAGEREIKSIRTSQLQRNRNKTKTDNHQQQYKGCFSVYTEKRRCLNIERGFNFTKLQSK